MDGFANQQPTTNVPTPAPVRPKKSRRGFGSKKVVLAVIAAVVLAALAVGGMKGYNNYTKLKKENARLSNPQEAAKAETDRLKAEVAKIIELPADESPTIATVVDAEKLKSQAFFAKAQNDDRVLMFPKAKKAVLYRPSTKKVIEVAPINIGNNQTQGATTNKTP